MNLISWLFTPFGGTATRQATGAQHGIPMSSGVSSPKVVNEDTALQVSAVWACLKLLTETVASLPLHTFDVSDEKNILDSKSTLSKLLRYSPNQYQNPMEFKETLMLNLLLHGNAYAQIERNTKGEPISLNPLPSNQVKPELLKDGSIVYTYFRHADKMLDAAVVAKQNMLHIKIFGNGIVGLSPIAHAKSTISGEIAAEDFAAKYYINAGRPSGTLSFDTFLKKEQREQLKESFKRLTEGTENAHKLLVLEGGMKYSQIQLSPKDMQMIEVRGQNLEDIARFWGVPSILINDNKDTTSWGSGIEQIILGWLVTGLQPLLIKWQEALEASLIKPVDRPKKVIRFDIKGLLTADTKGRAEYFQKLSSSALMTLNEARAELGLPPMAGGEKLYIQGAMVPVDNLQSGVIPQ